MEFKTQWAIISSYGERIRLAGESISFGQCPIDDFEPELAAVEHATKRVRENLASIKGENIPAPLIKVNREMLRFAWRSAWDRMNGEGDVFSDFEKELFG